MPRFSAGGLALARNAGPGDLPVNTVAIQGRVSAVTGGQYSAAKPLTLPAEPINLIGRLKSWPVRDQGNSMMCVAYAAAACLELSSALNDSTPTPKQLSAGFLYWAMRLHPPAYALEHWEEGGTQFENAVMALGSEGVCAFADCPDLLGKKDPSPSAKTAARQQVRILHDAVSQAPAEPPAGTDAELIMTNMINIVLEDLGNDRPVGMGFPIYPTGNGSTNWNDAGESDGTVEFPASVGPKSNIGGHAVCIVGYQPDADPETGGGYLLFRNSLGAEFGARHAIRGITGYGYGRISLADAKQHCWDFFTLRPPTKPCVTTSRQPAD